MNNDDWINLKPNVKMLGLTDWLTDILANLFISSVALP